MPEVCLRVERGQVVEADCAITFHVDELGAGYQLALDEGILDVDVELSRGSEVRFGGVASWEGGVKTTGFIFLNDSSYQSLARFNSPGARITYRSLYNEYSPCSRANGVVGNVTLTFKVELDASKSNGYASWASGSWTDSQTGEEFDDASTLNLK